MISLGRPFVAAGFLGLMSAGTTVGAQVVSSDVGKNLEYVQTGPTTVSPLGGGVNAFFFARNFYMNPGDFDGGTLTFPGPGSPQAFNISGLIDCCGNPGAGFQTDYMSKSDMDTNFPTGLTYTITSTNSSTSTSQSVDVTLAQDLYSTEIPTFDATTYLALQTVDPTAPMTINFNSFTKNPLANFAQGFLTFYDNKSGSVVSNFVGFDPTTTMFLVAAGTFTAGDDYTAELIFDEGVQGDATTYRSDNRTLISFSVPAASAAVPEPSTWVLQLTGFAMLGLAVRTRRASRTQA
jgi:hypothetical protein